MDELPEIAFYEGVTVDLVFQGEGPSFGDLFTICGHENPNFPPSGRFDFTSLNDLQFSQVEDYFGVRATSDEGDNVPIWLFPLVARREVDHDPGPFEGLRLRFNVLRNPCRRAEHFLRVVTRLANHLPVDVVYRTRELPLKAEEVVEQIRADINAIERYWLDSKITPGSPEALETDF